MSKFLLVFLCAAIVYGCSGKDNTSEERSKKYNEYVKTVEDNKSTVTADIPFDHSLKVKKAKDGSFEYTVTIDNPKIAMYSIEEIVVEKDKIGSKAMFPNIGIIDDEDAQYNMIPFQSNNEKGFQKGIQLNGVTNKKSFTLYVLVTWKDYAKLNTSRAFFHYTYDYDKEKAAQDQSEDNQTPEREEAPLEETAE